eukprot:4224174-Alexandrium_andersonii.AAC.1
MEEEVASGEAATAGASGVRQTLELPEPEPEVLIDPATAAWVNDMRADSMARIQRAFEAGRLPPR